jgi:hypothetical protein
VVCARGLDRLSRLETLRLEDESAAPCCCELVSTTDMPLDRGEPGRNSSTEGGKTKLGVDEFDGNFGLAVGEGVTLLTLLTGDIIGGGSGADGSLPSRTKLASW